MANNLVSLPNLSTIEWKKLMEENIDKSLFRELMMKQVNPALGYVPPSKDTLGYGAGGNGGHGHNSSAGAGGGGGHTHTLSVATQAQRPPDRTPDRWSENILSSMLASRFCWGVDAKCPFRKVLPTRVTDEKVVVFVVTNIDALLLYDDAYLFPSDALMSQMRLLAEAQ